MEAAGVWVPAFEWRHAIPIRTKASALAKPTDERVEIGATIEVLRRSIVTIKGREIGYLELADGRGWVPQTNAKSGKDFFVRQEVDAEASASAEIAVAMESSSSAGGDETVVRTPTGSNRPRETSAGASPEMDLAKSDRLRAALQTRNKATNDLRRALGDDVPDDDEAEPPPPSVAAATGPPARVWKAVRDPKSGRTYYVHTVTKETTWAAPHPDTMVKKVWKAVLDKRSGRTYYVNHETKEGIRSESIMERFSVAQDRMRAQKRGEDVEGYIHHCGSLTIIRPGRRSTRSPSSVSWLAW